MKHFYKLYAPLDADGNETGGAPAATPDRGDLTEAPAPAAAAPELQNPMDEKKAEPSETPAPEKKDIRIPKAEFDARIAKERERTEAANARAAELEAQLQATQATADVAKLEEEIAEMEAQRDQALLDGKKDLAATLSKDIHLKERQVNIATNKNLSNTARVQATEEIRFDMTVEKLEAQYPVLNPQHESYNAELVEDVLLMQEALMRRDRLTAAQGLEKAVQKIMSMQPKAAPEPEGDKPKTLADGTKPTDRAAQQKIKNAEAARTTPASTADVGLDHDKAGGVLPKVEGMTQEEFAVLPQAVIERMRGDEVSL